MCGYETPPGLSLRCGLMMNWEKDASPHGLATRSKIPTELCSLRSHHNPPIWSI